jgi:hypothetical protein
MKYSNRLTIVCTAFVLATTAFAGEETAGGVTQYAHDTSTGGNPAGQSTRRGTAGPGATASGLTDYRDSDLPYQDYFEPSKLPGENSRADIVKCKASECWKIYRAVDALVTRN